MVEADIDVPKSQARLSSASRLPLPRQVITPPYADHPFGSLLQTPLLDHLVVTH